MCILILSKNNIVLRNLIVFKDTPIIFNVCNSLEVIAK